MLPDFESRLAVMAEVIVRVGLNLQPGQPLLITEPYELHGVAPTAERIVDEIKVAAQKSGTAPSAVEVIRGDGPRLRDFATRSDWHGFTQVVSANGRRMEKHLERGGAFLFLLGSQPELLAGLPAGRASELHRIGWEYSGPVIQRLMRGAGQWTLVPAPSPGWAHAAHPDMPSAQRLAALWQDVFSALRVPATAGSRGFAGAESDWRAHLRQLQRARDECNTRRPAALRYVGSGTDLSVALPAQHVWWTAQLVTKAGVPFVVNLPTEEIYTAPRKNSASGTVRVARSISHGGSVVSGIELEFKNGRVVSAAAETGPDILRRLLDTDDGSARLGEVAFVPATDAAAPGPALADWQKSGRCFQHPLLDENCANHIALGESYRFCNRSPLTFALNRSQIHVDLPLDARIEFVPSRP